MTSQKNIKIGVLTLPLLTNYGGNIQAYALCKLLNNIGYQAELINIQYPSYQRKWTNISKPIKNIIKSVCYPKRKYYLSDQHTAYLSQHHLNFIQKHIPLSKPIYVPQLDIRLKKQQYDVVIVGSDQVWRKEYTPNITTYFLSSVSKSSIKIAYAASFGLEQWQYDKDETTILSDLAQNFDYFSVREDSAVSLCKTHLNINAEHVLDPTLLLTQHDYLQLCKSTVSQSVGKILTYILDEKTDKNRIIEYIGDQLNLDLDKFPVLQKTPMLPYKSLIMKPPEQWLKSFSEARFIITDSFHGVIFSIIFNKPFIAICNESRGGTRFHSLLNYFNLTDRLVDATQTLTDIDYILKKNINYTEINTKISKRRAEIIAELRHHIELA